MAENKKSFILYADLIHTVRKMSKQKIGELFMTILSYVNDENPEVKDKIVDLVFEPIKHQLKRDLVRWEDFKKKQSANGKLGGRPRLENQTVKNPKNPSLFKKSQKSPNVTVTVNDNVLSKESKEEEKIHAHNFLNGREPVIPTKGEVLECFISSGGNKEMAKTFYERSQATGWYHKGSPIINFKNLVYSFIENWNKNLKKENFESSAPPLRKANVN